MGKRFILVMAMWLGLQAGFVSAEGNTVARIGQSGEVLELEQQVGGKVLKNYLPLHEKGGVRYFSAGVGLEERSAEYPAFSLKLVFTAGGKPFLAGVDVAIQPAKGGAALRIPREQVEGPWLFVDLPSGIYDITATHGDRTQVLKGVNVSAGKQRIVYLRWAEDRGSAGRLPAE
ncbi:MAG TPA: hypothetical protein VLD60_03720 [Nitrospira sp.]|nr:hypothetical protein [Nitrospira sp.]